MEELNSAHRRSQAKCQLVQTSYIKRIELFLFSPYNKHLINRAKSVLTSVKILPYRPPARLISAKLKTPPKYRKLDYNKNKKAQKITHMLATFVDHDIIAHIP